MLKKIIKFLLFVLILILILSLKSIYKLATDNIILFNKPTIYNLLMFMFKNNFYIFIDSLTIWIKKYFICPFLGENFIIDLKKLLVYFFKNKFFAFKLCFFFIIWFFLTILIYFYLVFFFKNKYRFVLLIIFEFILFYFIFF